jgi:aspartate racemase
MKKLGMVGGTGPESTLVYYRDVIEGVKARRGAESLPMLTVESLSVFNVMSFCANRDYDGLADYLTAGFTNLANARRRALAHPARERRRSDLRGGRCGGRGKRRAARHRIHDA